MNWNLFFSLLLQKKDNIYLTLLLPAGEFEEVINTSGVA